ncbi:MAG: hypothetical protein MPK30_04600 [Gammaproteobacteria bacterium]|nr:hypothetical protein [Gammaproteobacteria bacterium]
MEGDKRRQALDLFDRALRARPGDREAMALKRLAHARTGDHEGALPCWEVALTAHPGDAQLLTCKIK